MNSSEIAFIRHGAYHQPAEVPSALLPHPLTKEGINHAKEGALELLRCLQSANLEIFETLYCSTSLRAYQTAEILLSELENKTKKKFTLQQSEDLCERSVGAMANLTISEIEKIMEKDSRYEVPQKGWKSRPEFKLPYKGAESLIEAGVRVGSFVKDRISSLKTRKLIIFVGHGAAFRFAAYHLGHWDIKTASAHSMYHGRPVLLKYENQKLVHNLGEWKKRKSTEVPKD